MVRMMLVILAALTASCHMARLSENYVLDDKAPNGVVIVSLTFEGGLDLSAFTLEYRMVGSTEGQSMHNAAFLRPPDVETDGRRGWLFPRELPPGDYEFYKWRAMSGNWSYWSPTDFSHRFTVAPRRATYIGNLNVVLTPDKRYLVQVHDERVRDVEAFRFRYPNIKTEQIGYGIMSEDQSRRSARRKPDLDDLQHLLPKAGDSLGRQRSPEQQSMDDLKDLLPVPAR